jgi:uncharacterized protein (UPF0297 family)
MGVHVKALLTAAATLLVVAPAMAGQSTNTATDQPDRACKIDAADAAWLSQALAKWKRAERDYLSLDPKPLPTVHVFDARCAYVLPAGSIDAAAGRSHDGSRVQINGRDLPVGPISFADGSGTFVMSLPSLWRAQGVNGTFGLERLMDAVLLQEIMHTRQAELASTVLDAAEAAKPKGAEISDDLIQELFKSDPAYVTRYEHERDLLFAAAAAKNDADSRRLAAQALAEIEQRRSTHFVGRNAYLNGVEDVFLTMEGMGQWMGYRMYLDLGVRPEAALAEVRRGGKYWSQDEGLAIMLVADRLSPDWKKRAFVQQHWGATTLLRAAIGSDRNDRPSQ